MSTLLDQNGKPLVRLPSGRARADIGGNQMQAQPGGVEYSFAYNAADLSSQEMGNWLPWIRSPDSETNPFRDRMVGRNRDLVRNDGWAAGGISRILDNTIGNRLRLSATPDYRALAVRFGIKSFDATWSDEFRKAAEALWRGFSDNEGRYNDLSRQMTVGQMFRLAFRHKLIDGESLILMHWRDDRVGYGAADYATTMQIVDPDRLSNPFQMVDSATMRGGVELDADGVPIAYHIRKAQQNDWYLSVESNTWERVAREDADGWRRVIHDFDLDRAGQHRGIGVFTPILGHAKMLAKYYGIELQAAAVAATFGTFVTSPYDPALVEDTLGGDNDLMQYQDLRKQWANERPAMLNGVRIPTLAPGEEINQVSAAHPHSGFNEFAHEMLGVVAASIGISREQLTQDLSKTNYSSYRAGALESYKTLTRRGNDFKANTATPVYASWLWEAMENGELPLPAGAPAFQEAKTAYSRCDWLGVARGWVDPVAEKQGAILGMDASLSTLQRECEEQGMDWEEVIQQRGIELKAFADAGLPPPSWIAANVFAADSAKPETPPTAE